ncbi:MAG: triple tyrosine motif-containing protein [Pyrinomonadaceae bacterium]
MRPRRIIFGWLLLMVVTCLFAIPAARAERLPIRVFTSADGLGSGFVDYLMRDSRGFLWFCTRDGLSRFDGSQFVTYQIGDTDSPPGVEFIFESSKGDYWITTTGGLYRFHPNAVSSRSPSSRNGRPILPAEYIDGIRGNVFEDRNGQLWLGSSDLYRVKDAGAKVTTEKIDLHLPKDLPDPIIIDFCQPADGSLWLNTTIGLIRYLPDGRVVYYREEKPVNQSNESMVLDTEGRIWYSHGLDLTVFIPEPAEDLDQKVQFTSHPMLRQPRVPVKMSEPIKLPVRPGEWLYLSGGDLLTKFPSRKLYQSSDRHIWLTTEKELFEFDGSGFRRYSAIQGLIPNMSRMIEDTAGNFWIGGQSGLARLDRRSLRSYGESDGLGSANVQAIGEAPDGTLYFANGDYFVSQFDGTGFKTQQAAISSTSPAIWMSRFAYLDRHDNCWILSRDKLYRFNRTNLQRPTAIYSTAEGLKSNELFQIYEDREGNIWTSQQPAGNADGRGLSRLAPGEAKFHTFTEADGYPNRRSVSSFVQDADGHLWLGFYEGGLARYADGRFTVFGKDVGIPEGVITDLLIDRTGRLWMSSSGGGVGRIGDLRAPQPQVEHINLQNGLSSNNIRTMTEDHLGNIYLGMVRGVDRIPPDEFRVNHYSVSDGLAGDFVVDSFCDKSGVVWFATTSGLSRLTPSAAGPREVPAVWLGGLRISGVAQPVSDLGQAEIGSLELGHDQNTLQVDFFGLEFNAGETLLYQYKLDGADRDWSAPTPQRTVTLANLQPGTYRFWVRVVTSNGQVSKQPAVVTFRIWPPVWLRWWFLLLVGVALAALAFGLFRYRFAQLRSVNLALRDANIASENLRRVKESRLAELERVRSRIATDLHDDIGASLTQIAILSEVAQQQSAVGQVPRLPLEKIYQVSTGLVSTMGDIVWAINPRKDHLVDLVQRMRRFASDVLTAKEIDFEFNAAVEDSDHVLGANIRREVYLIFKESINNIVKHSRAKMVEISFSVADGRLDLRIADDGVGFALPPDATRPGANAYDEEPGGNGLFSMKRRATELGGVFAIESGPGKGTVTILNFLLPAADDPAPVTTRTGSDGNRETV